MNTTNPGAAGVGPETGVAADTPMAPAAVPPVQQAPVPASVQAPVPAPRVHLDHAASSPLRAAARAAMLQAMGVTGNPAALHASGRRAKALLEDAREQFADAVGAHPTEVVFTSGGSEANTIALLSGMAARASVRPRLVVGGTEHPSVAGVRDRWASVSVLPVDADGVVLPDSLSDSLRGPLPDSLPNSLPNSLLGGASVGVVSVMAVNNETGTIQPIEQLAERAHACGAWFHTDAVQAPGHVPFSLADSGADLASLSGHKFGGPVGAGALLVRRGVELAPHGLGGRQEGGVRSGTQPLMLAAGLAAAAAEAVSQQAAEATRLGLLRQRLVDSVRATIDKAWVNGGEHVSPAITSITFSGTRADDVLLLLDQAGIDAGTGAACRAGVHQPSEVLLSMGRDLHQAQATIRFSFGVTTRESDIDALLAALPDAVSRARAAYHD